MTLEKLFEDKSIKAKAKAKEIADWLMKDELPLDELLAFAKNLNASDKATCIEGIETATKRSPVLADETLLDFVSKALSDDEPRVKWESAKVIGNIAKQFPTELETAIRQLLQNAKNKGTVIRWATAFALAEILKLKTENNKGLLPEIEALCETEEDNGVKKKYLDAIKKVKK